MKQANEILSPEFWIKEWNNHGRQFAKEPWSACRSVGTWNRMAKTYHNDDKSNSEVRERRRAGREQIIELMEKRGMLRPGIRVLDVGCGTGTWAFAFAERGAEVVGIDFSNAMTERMKQETPPELRDRITCIEGNWHDFDVEKEGFAGSFDLVFANMTPAVNGPENFLKLIKTSREWCFFAGWAGRRSEPLLEGLWLHLTGREKPSFRSDIIFPLNLAYSMGFSPSLQLRDVKWENEMKLDEAEDFFGEFLSRSLGEPAGQIKPRIREYLSKRAENGRIMKSTTGRTGFIIWKVA